MLRKFRAPRGADLKRRLAGIGQLQFVSNVGRVYRVGGVRARVTAEAGDLPAHAIVLSVDKKSQTQALDRTQLGLPMKKGRAGTLTHAYKRHGSPEQATGVHHVIGDRRLVRFNAKPRAAP